MQYLRSEELLLKGKLLFYMSGDRLRNDLAQTKDNIATAASHTMVRQKKYSNVYLPEARGTTTQRDAKWNFASVLTKPPHAV